MVTVQHHFLCLQVHLNAIIILWIDDSHPCEAPLHKRLGFYRPFLHPWKRLACHKFVIMLDSLKFQRRFKIWHFQKVCRINLSNPKCSRSGFQKDTSENNTSVLGKFGIAIYCCTNMIIEMKYPFQLKNEFLPILSDLFFSHTKARLNAILNHIKW